MFVIGSTVIHPIHGLGTVQGIAEDEIMGQRGLFASIFFQEARITVNVRADGEKCIIRPLIEEAEIAKVMEHLRSKSESLPTKSSDRYNVNMRKITNNDIYGLAEVVRDLTSLSKGHKLSPKEQTMLKQTRRVMAIEFAFITHRDIEEIETEIDDMCRNENE